ncbi:MAG: electron transfer flavoprotein subunit beta, partial [Thermodesulfobacteriota bacterium]|nr:electron transfer flavoprotein subunit beta [Thermodesulfobacteriota bacterium]
YDEKNKTIRIQRKLEEHHEIVESTLPALITVEREINTPRYPTVPGRLDAEEAPVPVWNNGFLKLDPKTIGLQGSPTQVRRIFAPEREQGEIIPGEGENKDTAVKNMFDKLADWDFITLEE